MAAKTGEPPDNHAQSQVHWRASSLMVSSLLVSIALACGHHAFYASLHGSEVDDKEFKVAGWETTEQQINLTAGNAFAFVVKAGLVLATSIAYMQLVFRAMRMQSFKLDQLDQWYAALHDLISLFRIVTFYKYPLLTLIAITAWLLPLAAIVAPASLSIMFRDLPVQKYGIGVNLPAFDSLAFNNIDYSNMSTLGYLTVSSLGPSQEVTNIAQAAMSTGDILPISAQAINVSYSVTSPWPHMICDEMDAEVQEALKENIGSYIDNRDGPEYQFYSWVKRHSYANVDGDAALPFTTNSSGNWTFNFDAVIPMGPMPPDVLYIAVIPKGKYVERWIIDGVKEEVDMEEYFDGSTLLQCHITDRLYTIRFTWDGSDQTQHIDIESITNGTGLIYDDDYSRFEMDFEISPSMETVHREATGSLPARDIPTIGDESLRYSLRRLSYASMFQAFSDVLLGTWPEEDLVNWAWMTKAFSTSLASTSELADLSSGTSASANALAATDSGDYFDLLSTIMRPNKTVVQLPKLKDALVELFFNVTVSMTSSESLQYNSTSPYSPDWVNVTQAFYGNTYSYSPQKLWLAYGVAIAVTLLNVCIGLMTMFFTKSCYTADFSTIVRLARNANVDADMREQGLPGRDPLPKSMANARFSLVGLGERPREGSGYAELAQGDGGEKAALKQPQQAVNEVL